METYDEMVNMGTDDAPKTLASVEKTLAIIEALWKLDGAGVTELANHLGMSKSTVHIHLTTLERKGYVAVKGGTYNLGLRFLNFGEHAKRSQPLYEVAKLSVEELAAETGKRVFCMVEQHGLATTICLGEGSQSVQTDIRVGTHSYMHCSSAGKAILAHLPNDRVNGIIDKWGLRQFTDQTITDRDQLRNDLKEGRERGVFFNQEEYREGVTSIGAPVVGDDRVYGAIAISGPAMSLQGDLLDSELPNQLLTAINKVEVNMTFS